MITKIKFSNHTLGEIYIILHSILWGIFPVFVIFSYQNLGPITSSAFGTLFSGIFFAIFMSIGKNWSDLKNPKLWHHIFWITLCIGIIFYSLYYLGLKASNPGNVSLISLFEIFTSFLIFQIWKKNKLTRPHLFGAGLMLLGSIIILYRSFTGFNYGDWLIILACFVAPYGNYNAKQARKIASSNSIMFARSVLSFPFLLLLAHLTQENIMLESIISSIWQLFLIGFIVLGFAKILWLEGIHKIDPTKALVISSSISVFITLLSAFFLLHQNPSTEQLLALPLMLAGLWLITKK